MQAPLKVCAMILSYGSVPYLPRVIESVKGIDTFILNPNKSWWSDKMVDHTKELAGDVKVINADLDNETDARNYAISYCDGLGYDVMIMPDTDEIIDDVGVLIAWIEDRWHTTAEAFCAEIIDYYPDENSPLPKRGHCPIIAVRLGIDKYFYDKRCFGGEWIVNNNITIHHYSLLLKDEFKFKIEAKLYDDAYPPVEYKGMVEL